MKIFGLWILFMVMGTSSLVFLASTSSSSFTGSAFRSATVRTNRKLKENRLGQSNCTEKKRDLGSTNLEDYRPFDPSPSSRACIQPKPIEHGTPLNPYIPKPTPPAPPKNGGTP